MLTMVAPTVVLTLCSALFAAAAPPRYNPKPFSTAKQKRQFSTGSTSALQADLGYETYEGVHNTTTDLYTWRGIRYAAPPTGQLRWQAPQVPAMNRSSVIQADRFASICPQSNPAPRTAGMFGSEDCLFLNVYAPPNATSLLPVLVWIHGGGYGAGNGRQDLSAIINANSKGFVGVAIQYRVSYLQASLGRSLTGFKLGAFGFMSSDEVYRNGVVNAGLLDQNFALHWVQSYISLFGGDPSRVSIAGESAGGGSVMLQDMAYGGTIGNSLFVNTLAASPYLPMQYDYKDWIPTQAYFAYATAVGCPPTKAYGNTAETIFDCIVSKDTETLQTASFNISGSGTFGTWGFLPVTDGTFVQQTPSQQLLKRQINGERLLVGNNADEGPLFTPQNINTEDDLLSWLRLTFPLFTNEDIAKILFYYPSSNASVNPSDPLFPTEGDSGATALNQSDLATGQQQRANNIYAETTFVCPSYWMAEAYAGSGRSSYKYQYSVSIALHATDVAGYFGPATPNQGPDFAMAFMRIWGNFVTQNNPSIPAEVANGAGSGGNTAEEANPASNWPAFNVYAPYQVDLNQTGGTAGAAQTMFNGHNYTEVGGAGLRNDFRLVNAYTWEGGRGYRCDFWRSFAGIVPE